MEPSEQSNANNSLAHTPNQEMEPSEQSIANNLFALTALGFQMLCEEQRRDLHLESFEQDYLTYFSELEIVPQDELMMMIKCEQTIYCQGKSQNVGAETQQVSVLNGTSAIFVKGENCDFPSRNTQETVSLDDEVDGKDFYFYESEFSDDMDLE